MPQNMSRMNVIFALTATALITLSHAVDVTNECLHAWSERCGPTNCKVSADCEDSTASCVFALQSEKYICCRPKKDAIEPVCPDGRALLSVGKNSRIIVCDKNSSGSTEDQCPYGFKCVESMTDFTKNPGQSNTVCCDRGSVE